MQLDIYKSVFTDYFNEPQVSAGIHDAVQVFNGSPSVFFIGNGGSNSICSHMMEDFAKMGRYKTYAFSDPAMITCYANDYGYENALAEWLKVYASEGDILVAISSSGNSPNILNAVNHAKSTGMNVITLSGFDPLNKLNGAGAINFHIPVKNYGVVECFHQVIVHAILDEIIAQRNHE